MKLLRKRILIYFLAQNPKVYKTYLPSLREMLLTLVKTVSGSSQRLLETMDSRLRTLCI